jgi:hypothetical protein
MEVEHYLVERKVVAVVIVVLFLAPCHQLVERQLQHIQVMFAVIGYQQQQKAL